MATSSTPKDSASLSNEFGLQWATSSFQSQYKADITFSFYKLDTFSSFFSFSTKYIPHLIFPINFAQPYMVFTCLVLLKWSLTASVLNRVLPLSFHIFELLLGWSVFVILINPQSTPFPSIYVKHQLPVSSHFDSSGSKIHLYWNLVFFGIFSKINKLISAHSERLHR